MEWRSVVLLFLAGLDASTGKGEHAQTRKHSLLEPISTTSTYAIAISTYRWARCIEARAMHAHATRPPSHDLVLLFDDTRGSPEYKSAERFVESRADTHIVRFSAIIGQRTLIRLGYPQTALQQFSPFHSGFSKVAWVVWGSRQSYQHIWFAEDDVLVPCAWFNFVRAFPRAQKHAPLSKHERKGGHSRAASGRASALRHNHSSAIRSSSVALASAPAEAPRRRLLPHSAKAAALFSGLSRWSQHRAESLLAINCTTRAGQPWASAARCSFCTGGFAATLTKCLLALSRISRGLLRAVDKALRSGVSGHHELLLPHTCSKLNGCELSDIVRSKAQRFLGVVLAPNQLDQRALSRIGRAVHLSTVQMGGRELSRANGCGVKHGESERSWNVIFHPAKCELPALPAVPSAGDIRR